jgi:hypothetical protein
MTQRAAAVLAGTALLASISCGGGGAGGGGTEIRRLRLAGMADVITKNGVAYDNEITTDGNGSIRVTVNGPATIRIAQLGDIDLENALLVYQASLRTEDLDGETYLEMYCGFDGRGEYWSRGLDHALSGTNDWRTVSTAFKLETGQNPDTVKLNLHVNGTGTVWIDDIRLLERPLR